MTSLRTLGELGLIARLRRRVRRSATVLVGIGDDAAVLRIPHGQRRLLFASDMLVEGVHFNRRSVSARDIGWKALACNISDIAAMGGHPRWAVVSLGVPRTAPVAFVDGLYAGLEHCARRFHMTLVGGDTVRAPQVIVDVAILGTVEPRHLVLRSGALVGDILFVTGRLGGSLPSGRHATFIPRLREAQALLKQLRVHAMMDLSDGLAADLRQMSRASGVTFRIDADRIPVSNAARTVFHALMDGEDFELLFALSAREAARVPRRLGNCPVTRIGSVIRRGIGVELLHTDGRVRPLLPRGFRHF